jgi:hypothetical protein
MGASSICVSETPSRQPEGGEREPNKIISQEPGLCPTFKTPRKKS